MMEAFLQFAGMSGSMGLPSLVVGTILFLYFSIRKQEAVVRTEQLETIERLKADRLQEEQRSDERDAEIAQLRQELAKVVLENTKLQVKIIKLGGDPE